MWPDHLVSPTLLSKRARGVSSGEIEEGLQTQRVDLVEASGKGQGAPTTQPHVHLSGQEIKRFFSGEKEEPQRKDSQMLTCVYEVSKTKASSNSVLPKEGASANYPTHACRNFNLDLSALLSNVNTYYGSPDIQGKPVT